VSFPSRCTKTKRFVGSIDKQYIYTHNTIGRITQDTQALIQNSQISTIAKYIASLYGLEVFRVSDEKRLLDSDCIKIIAAVILGDSTSSDMLEMQRLGQSCKHENSADIIFHASPKAIPDWSMWNLQR
jgi:hypothetical protein